MTRRIETPRNPYVSDGSVPASAGLDAERRSRTRVRRRALRREAGPDRSLRSRWLGAAGGKLLGALTLVVLGGCGAATPSASTLVQGVPGARAQNVHGVDVVRIERDLGERVLLSLWIDAGSRDADVPQVATLTAWQLADHHRLEARVLPDATALTLPCERAALGACAEQLAGVLRGGPETTPEGIEQLLKQLQAGRRNAAAERGRDRATAAAVALLGKGMNPLGIPKDDALVTASAIEAFRKAHYGSNRALLIGVGDFEGSELEGAFSTALARASYATSGRAVRSAAPITTSVEVQVAEHAELAFAVAQGSEREARGLAAYLLDPLGAGAKDASLRASVLPFRGATVTLVQAAHVGDPIALLREIAFDAFLYDAELSQEPAALLGDGARELAAYVGERWATEGPSAVKEMAVAAALGVSGGRGDRSTEGDPDEALRAASSEQALAALMQARRWVHEGASITGASSTDAAHLQQASSGNGARVQAARLPSASRFAATLWFTGGASEESAANHGRTALIATLLARACGQRDGAMSERIRALGARVMPIVEPERAGLAIELPTERWKKGLDLLLRCGLYAQPRSTAIEAARSLLAATLLDHPQAISQSWAAQALSPESPGVIAPEGSFESVSALRSIEVREALAALRAGGRITLRVAGAVDPNEVIGRAMVYLSRLPSGTVEARASMGPPAESVVAHSWTGPSIRVVVAFGATVAATPSEASAFAHRVAQALQALGSKARWSGGDAGAWGCWAAVALDVDDVELAALPARVADVLATLQPSPRQAATTTHDPVWSRSDPLAWTRSLESTAPSRGGDTVAATWNALKKATVRYVIARPNER